MDSVEHAGEELRKRECRGQAKEHGDRRQPHALANDQLLYLASLRAQCHADADLARASAHRIAHYAIETYRGKDQTDGPEDAEESSSKAWQEEGIAKMLL